MKNIKENFPLDIVFSNINVNVLDTQSGIFIGENLQYCWASHSKTNSGFGTIAGINNLIEQPVNIVYDPDYIDNPADI